MVGVMDDFPPGLLDQVVTLAEIYLKLGAEVMYFLWAFNVYSTHLMCAMITYLGFSDSSIENWLPYWGDGREWNEDYQTDHRAVHNVKYRLQSNRGSLLLLSKLCYCLRHLFGYGCSAALSPTLYSFSHLHSHTIPEFIPIEAIGFGWYPFHRTSPFLWSQKHAQPSNPSSRSSEYSELVCIRPMF